MCPGMTVKKLQEFSNAFFGKKIRKKLSRLFGGLSMEHDQHKRDGSCKKGKERKIFYHGILLGLLGYKATWLT